MKRRLILFVFSSAMITMTSCNGQKKESNAAPEAMKPAAAECTEIQKNDINPMEAAKYIANFMQDDSCMKFARDFGMVGFIPMSDEFEREISLVESYVGYTIYPCIDTTKYNSQLYFAVMRDSVCPGLESTLPINSYDKFLKCAILNQNLPQLADSNKVLEYLKTEFDLKDFVSQSKYPKPKDIESFNEMYKKKFDASSNYVNVGAGFVQKSSLSSSYQQIKNDRLKIEGYVIFLGKEPNLDSDQVRLVLIPYLNDGKLHLAENAICLERSWPPIGSKK